MVSAFLTTIFISLLVPVVLAAVSVVAADEEIATHCRFTLGGQIFDLCPIFKAGRESNGWTVEFEKETPPTVTKIAYRVSFGGALLRNDSLPDHIQCPEGTWICMTKYNTRPHHDNESPRILQVVPVAGRIIPPSSALFSAEAGTQKTALNITVQLSPYQKDDVRHKILHVRYHGGHYVGARQLADIQYECDHDAEETTPLTFLYEWRGQHAFRWKTKHACGQILTNEPADDPPPVADPSEVEEPPADNEEGDSSELLDLPPYPDRNSRTKWVLVLSSTGVLALLLYFTLRPPLVIRRHVLSFVKVRPSLARFRVGEHILLRWAEEDMGYEDGEEDLMVNGERDPFFDADEQIPLKPSPRKGPVPTYGSAL